MRAFVAFGAAALALMSAAWAGTPAVEADRCWRFLKSLSDFDVVNAANVTIEQFNVEDIPMPYLQRQRNDLSVLISGLGKLGGGEPDTVETLVDVKMEETGDIIKLQRWTFPNKKTSYAGCVSYPGLERPWNMSVQIGDDFDGVISTLKKVVVTQEVAPAGQK